MATRYRKMSASAKSARLVATKVAKAARIKVAKKAIGSVKTSSVAAPAARRALKLR